MLYYKVKPEFDNKKREKWSEQKRQYIQDSIWVANELYTASELRRNGYKCTAGMFEEIRIKKTNTYFFFGARFAMEGKQ